MTPSARIAAVIELLGEIASTPRPADGVAARYMRERRFIGAKDRQAIAGHVFALLRRHARLGWWLDRAGPVGDAARGRVVADLVLMRGWSTPALVALFDGRRHGPARLDDREIAFARRLEGRPLDDPAMPERVRLECPDWAEAPLRRACGAGFREALTALLDEAPLDLRVNTLKTGRETALAALGRAGLEAVPTPLSPLGLRLGRRRALGDLALYRDGAVEVQDEGSQLVALLTDARPGMQVLDLCAGAGGKALALAAAMANKGRVVAGDVSEGRLERARERVRRAGADNVELRAIGPDRDPWLKRQGGRFDRVLVDAPCSGVGAWRRNPDARWRPFDLAGMTATQDQILAGAGALVRPGGRLVYATCSLLPDENEDRVARFLGAQPGFRLEPVDRVWHEAVGTIGPGDGETLTLTPARHGTDGFFVAVLERA